MADLKSRALFDISDFRRGTTTLLTEIDRVQKRLNSFSSTPFVVRIVDNTAQLTANLATYKAAMAQLNAGGPANTPRPLPLPVPATPSPVPANGPAQLGNFNGSLTVVSNTLRSYTTVLGLVTPQLSSLSYWTLRLTEELGLFAGMSNLARYSMLGLVAVAGTLFTAIVALGRDGFNEARKLADSFAILEANGVSAFTAVEARIKALQGLSLTTQRKSITDYAEGLATLQKAGQTGADGLNILKNAAVLASNEGTNLNQTSIDLTRNMLQFGDDASQAGRYVDVLTKASNLAIGSAADLSQGLNTVGTIAKFAGFSLEETTGFLVELDNKGLSARDKGATALRNVFAAITSPTQQFRKAAAGLGVDLEDSTGKIRTAAAVTYDLIQALQKNNVQYDEATGKVRANAEAVAAASTLFRTRGFAAILSLTDQSLKVGDALKVAAGEGEKFSNILAQTPTGALDRFKGASENLALSFGKIITPALVGGLTGLTGLFRALEGVFNKVGENRVLIGGLTLLVGYFAAVKAATFLAGLAVLGFNSAVMLSLPQAFRFALQLDGMTVSALGFRGAMALAGVGIKNFFTSGIALAAANPWVAGILAVGVAAVAVGAILDAETQRIQKQADQQIQAAQDFIEALKKVEAEASKLGNKEFTGLKKQEFVRQDTFKQLFDDPNANIAEFTAAAQALRKTREELARVEKGFTEQQKQAIGLTDEQSAAFDALNEKILALQVNFRSSGATDFEKDLQRVKKEIDDLTKSVNKDFGANGDVLDSKLSELRQLEQDLLSQSIGKEIQAQADERLEVEKTLAGARIALIQDGRTKANATLELELTDIKKNYAKRIDEAQKNLNAAKRGGTANPGQIGSLEAGVSALKRLQGEEEVAARAKRAAEIVKLESELQDKLYALGKTGMDRRSGLESGALELIKDSIAKREEQRRIDLGNANRSYDDLERATLANQKKTTDPRLIAEYGNELERLAQDRVRAVRTIEQKAGDDLINLRKNQIEQLRSLEQTLAQGRLGKTQSGLSALEGSRDRALTGATTPQERAQIEAQSQAQILKLQQSAAQQILQLAQDTAKANLSKALENAKTLGASEGAARIVALKTYNIALETAQIGFDNARVQNSFEAEKRIRDLRLEGLKTYLQKETETLNILTGLELETARKRLEAKLSVYKATGDREAVKAIEDALRGVGRQVAENSRGAKQSLEGTKTTVLDLRAALEDAFGKNSPLEKAQDNAQKPFEQVAKGARDAAKALSEELGKVKPGSLLEGQLKAQIAVLNSVQLEAQKGGQAARASAELNFNTEELGKAREFAVKRAKILYDTSPEVYAAGYGKELAAQQLFLETRLKNLKEGSSEYEQVQGELETNRAEQSGITAQQRQSAADMVAFKREELEASLNLTTSDTQRQAVLKALVSSSVSAVQAARENVAALELQKAPQADILKAKRELSTLTTKQLEDEKKLYSDGSGVTQAREELDLRLKLAQNDAQRATIQAQILSSDTGALERATARVGQAQAEGKPQEFINDLIGKRNNLLEQVKNTQDSILEGSNRQIDGELTLLKARQGLQAVKARSDAEVLQAQQDGLGVTLQEIANVERLIAQGKARGQSESELSGLTAQKLGLEGTLYAQVNSARRAGLGIESEKLSLLEAQSKTMLELSGLADDAVAVSQIDLRLAQKRLELAQERLAEEKKSGTESGVRGANEGVLSAQTDVSAKTRAASVAQFSAAQDLLDAQREINAAKLEENGLADDALIKAQGQLQKELERKATLEAQLAAGQLSVEGQRKAATELEIVNSRIATGEREVSGAALSQLDERLSRESRIAQAKLAQLGLDDTALGNAKLQVATQEALIATLENKLKLETLTPKEQADTTAALEEARGKLAGDRKAVTAEELATSGKVNAELEKRLGFQERLLSAGLKALGLEGNALVQAQSAVALSKIKITNLERELAGNLSNAERAEKTVQLEELKNQLAREGQALILSHFGEEERLLGITEAQIAAQLELAGLDQDGILGARIRLGIEQSRLERMERELATGGGSASEQAALALQIDKQRGVVAGANRAVGAAETEQVDKRLSLETRLLTAKIKQKGLSDTDLSVLQALVVLEQTRTAQIEERLKNPELNQGQRQELEAQLEESRANTAEKLRAIEEKQTTEAGVRLSLEERLLAAKAKQKGLSDGDLGVLQASLILERERTALLEKRLKNPKLTTEEKREVSAQIEESKAKSAEKLRAIEEKQTAELDKRLPLEERLLAAKVKQKGLSENDLSVLQASLILEQKRTAALEKRLKNPKLSGDEKRELGAQIEESKAKSAEKQQAISAQVNANLELNLGLLERQFQAKLKILGSGQDEKTALEGLIALEERRLATLQKQLSEAPAGGRGEIATKVLESQAKIAETKRGLDKLAQTDLERRLGLEDRVTAARILQAGLSSGETAVQRINLAQEETRAKRIEQRLSNPALSSTEKDELRVQLEESRGRAVEKRLALRAAENADLEKQLALSERLVAAEIQRTGRDNPLVGAAAQLLTTQRAIAQLEGELQRGGLSSAEQKEKEVKLTELQAKLVGDERNQRAALYGEAQRLLETEKSQYELKLKMAGLDGNAIASAQLERDFNAAALGQNAKQLAETNLTETERNKLLEARNALLGQSVDAERKVFDERYKQVALNLQGDKNKAAQLLAREFAGDDVAAAGVGLKSAQSTLEVAKKQLAEGQRLKLNQEQLNALVEAERNARAEVSSEEEKLNRALEAREILQRSLNDSLGGLRQAGGAQSTGLQSSLRGLSLATDNVARAAQEAAPFLDKVARGEALTAEEANKAKGPIDALASSLGAKRQALEAASKAYRDQVNAISGLQDAVATLSDIVRPQDGAGFARVEQRANEALTELEAALKTNDTERITKATSEFNSAFSSYRGLLDQNRAAKTEVEKAQADLITAQAGTDLKATEEATKRLAEAQKKFADLGGDKVKTSNVLESGAVTSLDALRAQLPTLEAKKVRLKAEADRLEQQARAQQLEVSQNSVKVVDSLKLVLDRLSSEGLFKDLFKGVPEQAAQSGFEAGDVFGKAFKTALETTKFLLKVFEQLSKDNPQAKTVGQALGLTFADGFKSGTANIGAAIVKTLASNLPVKVLGQEAAKDLLEGFEGRMEAATDTGAQAAQDLLDGFDTRMAEGGNKGAKAADDLLDGFDARMREAGNSNATDGFVQKVVKKLATLPGEAAKNAEAAQKAVQANLGALEQLQLKFPNLFSALPDEAARKGAEAGDRLGLAIKTGVEDALKKLDFSGLIAGVKREAGTAYQSAVQSVTARASAVPNTPAIVSQAPPIDSRTYTYTDNSKTELNITQPPGESGEALAQRVVVLIRSSQEASRRDFGKCL